MKAFKLALVIILSWILGGCADLAPVAYGAIGGHLRSAYDERQEQSKEQDDNEQSDTL